MRPRTASRLAWSLGSFSIALMIGALVLIFGYRHGVGPEAFSEFRWNFPDVLDAMVIIRVPVIGIVLASKLDTGSVLRKAQALCGSLPTEFFEDREAVHISSS